MNEKHPEIDSFIIRFIRSARPGAGVRIRGNIRHLQSNEQRSFRSWEDAEAFMNRFIPMEWIRREEPGSKPTKD